MGAQTSTHYLNAHISSRARGCDVPFIQLLVNELRLKCTKCFLRKKCTASHFQVEVLIKWCNYDGIKLRKSHRQGPSSSPVWPPSSSSCAGFSAAAAVARASTRSTR